MNARKLKLTLLYVEDDKDTRIQLSEVFKQKVETLYVAKDGLEALEIFKKKHIHLIISDFLMPRMNGNELCGAIKKIQPLTTFVLFSAFNNSQILIDAIDVGVDKFLQKPISATKLFNILEEIEEQVINKFRLEKATVCLREAEKIALLSYWDVNLHTNTITFSNEAKELFNLSGKAVDYTAFSLKVKENDRTTFLKVFEQKVFEDEKIDEIVVINNVNNKKIYIHIVAKRWESSVCGTKHVIGLFQDVSHYEEQKISLIKESQSDPMLKIYNKKFLTVELDNLIKSSKRYGHPIGVLFFDIDNFKHINETHGHLVADEILQELSSMIENDIRQSDTFGRWGGDEFVVITGYSSPDSTLFLGNKLLEKVNTHPWCYDIKVTISMGISFYEVGDDVESLLDRADKKMLEAKSQGKNRYVH